MEGGRKARTLLDVISMFGVVRFCVASWPRILAIITGGIIVLDVSHIAIPSEYLIALVITGLILGVLFGYFVTLWLHEKAADKKVAEGKIASTADLAYDNKYIVASVIGTIVGGLIGIFLTPVLVQNYIIGGEVWTYVAVCAILTPIFVSFFVILFHWGVRETLVRANDYKYVLKETVNEISDDLTPEQKQLINNQLAAWGKKKI